MTAQNQNVRMWAGDSLKLRVVVRNRDGSAPPLTGSSARWWMGRDANSTGADVFVQKQSGSGITFAMETIPGVAFLVPVYYVQLLPADTAALVTNDNPAGPFYYHELEVHDVTGNVSTVMTGRFILQADIVE